MADMTRGERTVQLFAKVISNPEKKFTISDLMTSFEIPESERRNVQRDMRFLSEMDGGRYIAVDTVQNPFSLAGLGLVISGCLSWGRVWGSS